MKLVSDILCIKYVDNLINNIVYKKNYTNQSEILCAVKIKIILISMDHILYYV